MPEPTLKPVAIASELASPNPAQPEKAGPQPLVKPLEPAKKGFPIKTLIVIVVIILAGIGSGFGLNTVSGGAIGIKSTADVSQSGVKVDDVIGSADEKSFPDQTEGVLVKGGIEGEGSHHLLRPGGPSQNVYLTSSVVDLDLFVDHKIQVWGETFAAQKVGWLMDVGRVKVIELNSSKPFEEETTTSGAE